MRACHQPWGFNEQSSSSTSSHMKPAKSTLHLQSQMGWSGPWGCLDNQEGTSKLVPEREELPTGVITVLTRCYLTTCGEGEPCYSFACPWKATATLPLVPAPEPPKALVSPLHDRCVTVADIDFSRESGLRQCPRKFWQLFQKLKSSGKCLW